MSICVSRLVGISYHTGSLGLNLSHSSEAKPLGLIAWSIFLPHPGLLQQIDIWWARSQKKKKLKEKEPSIQETGISSTFIYRIYIIYVNRDAASIAGSSRSSTKVTRMCSSGTLGMENCLRGWNMCHFRVGVGLGLGLGGLDQYEHL